MMKNASLAIALGGLIFMVGCSRNGSPLEQPEAPGATVDTVASVRVEADVDVWPGNEDILAKVTPVRLAIDNESTHPVSFKFENFELVADDGTIYHALPPFKIEGSVDRAVAVHDPITEPGFAYDRFRVSPYYSAIYPGIDAHDAFGSYDPFYYDNYYRVWQEIELPTVEMIERALPEGVIDQGGRLSGFLYFERVDSDKESVMLRAKVVNPEKDEVVGTAELWFPIRAEE